MRPFEFRVRLVRAWIGLGVGLCAGALAAGVWAGLDWLRIAYADLASLGALAGAGAVLGAVVGASWKLDRAALARSLDRRAGLQDRLGTAAAVPSGEFGEAQRGEAEGCLEGASPAKLYPIRGTRWHGLALALAVASTALFLLGNSPLARGPKTEEERKELAAMGEKVRRIAKPLLQKQDVLDQNPDARNAAKELDRFAMELEHGKLNREEALRKANDLAAQAEKAVKDEAQKAQETLAKGESVLSKWEKAQLDKAGLDAQDLEKLKLGDSEKELLARTMKEQGFQSPPSKFNAKDLARMGLDREAETLANLTPQQVEALQKTLAERQQRIQKEIDRIDAMTPEERAKHMKELEALKKQLETASKLMDALKLSDKARKALEELANSPEAKQLREMMEKMAEKAQQMQQGQPPSKEEIEKMQKALEALAGQLQDPQLKQEVLEQMRKTLEALKKGDISMEAAMAMMAAMGLGPGNNSGQNSGDGNGENGDGGTGSQDVFQNTGRVNKSDKEMETKGKGSSTAVKGQWGEKGQEWTLEVKAPTKVGSRSSVPYRQVLPSYRKAAEKAMNTDKIPREQEKRVREYFDSLNETGGKK
ncbi:MAG: hypothetical protein KIT11_10730 [Fimbriimonadaceae bacterium]|nr:hypothetical protein [Fimbriimonadaceae bacterium]QYK55795.1 MAG: hypothetical protein KF733_12400 [Fimbriimonadaceae bacterium]